MSIAGLAKISNLKRSMKAAEQALAAATKAEAAGRDVMRAVAATQAGKVAEDLRRAADEARKPAQRRMLTEAELLEWRGPLPPGMTGAE